MEKILLSFEKDDEEMKKLIREKFGENVILEESKELNGMELLITAIIPIASFSLQLVDFLLTNLRSSDKKKRIIITQDGYISLSGYSEKEAEKILKNYFDCQNANNSHE